MSGIRWRRVTAVAGAAVVTAGVSVGIASVRAYAHSSAASPAAAAAADTSIVERFDYPGADAIKAKDPRVVLLRGDGHILYDPTCATPPTGVGQIKVRPQADDTPICFTVTGGSGWLGMQIQGVLDIDGRKATTTATGTATATVQRPNEAQQNVTLDKTAVTPVGIEGGKIVPTVLLNLTVTAS